MYKGTLINLVLSPEQSNQSIESSVYIGYIKVTKILKVNSKILIACYSSIYDTEF